MKNNKKMTRKTIIEKRRLAFEKRNVKKEQNLARYGAEGGSALVMAKTTEFNRRFIAAFLALVFAISCLVVGINFASKAEETNTKDILVHDTALMDDEGFVMQTIQNNTNGMYLSKGVKANGNGSYDLKLESYATGNVEKVPTDFILVVDQSGSMARKDIPDGTPTPVSYTTIDQHEYDETTENYEPEYYYRDEQGNYYRTYRKRGPLYQYFPGGLPNDDTEAPSLYINDLGINNSIYFFSNSTVENDISTSYYYKDSTGYHKVYFYIRGVIGEYLIVPYYTKDGKFERYSHSSDNIVALEAPEKPVYKPWGNDSLGSRLYEREYYSPRIDPRNVAIAANNVAYSLSNTVCKGIASIAGYPEAYTYGQITSGFNTGMFIYQDLYKRHVGYNELCYIDANGNEVTLLSSEYCDENGIPTTASTTRENGYTGTLYRFDESISRLEALNNSAKSFIHQVAEQTNIDKNGNETPVDHRIAIVGFSSFSDNTSSGANDAFKNTEVLTGVDLVEENFVETGSTHFSLDSKNHNGTQYKDYSPTVNSLLSVQDESNIHRDPSGNDTREGALYNAVDAITAYGGTQPKYGFEMANGIITERNANNQQYYTKLDGVSQGERNTVVIFFTDGRPGDYTNSNQYEEANKVVSEAATTKSFATVYSIGVFGESDANPLTYARYQIKDRNNNAYSGYTYYSDYNDRLNAYSYDGDYDQLSTLTYDGTSYTSVLYRIWQNTNDFPSKASDTIADYMRTVSSEYVKASSFVDPIWFDPDQTKRDDTSYEAMVASARGNSNGSKYYYLATNQATLTQAFQDIFEAEASSYTNYNADNSKMQDLITDSFDTTNATVSVKTMSVKTWDADTKKPLEWEDCSPLPDRIEPNLDKDTNIVTVTGFDYSSHYVSQSNVDTDNVNQSKKLVVTISNISTDSTNGRLLTNTESESGIFYKADEAAPFSNDNPFPVPSVTRYKYTSRFLGDNESPQMDTKLVLKDREGQPVSSIPESLKFFEASAQGYPEITTLNTTGYSWVPANYVKGTVYTLVVESFSEDYKLQVETSNRDASGAYSYYWGDGITENEAINEFDSSFVSLLPLEDHDLIITSKTNFRPATITMKTQGVQGDPASVDFSDKTKQFPLHFTLTKGSDSYSEDITATLNRNGADEEITLVYSDGGYSTYLDGGGKSQALSLADGERIDFSAPSNFVFSVSETEHNGYDASVNENGEDSGSITITSPTSNRVDVVNTLSENPVASGINKDNNAGLTIACVIAGLVVISTGAGAAYIYRKKDEFVV